MTAPTLELISDMPNKTQLPESRLAGQLPVAATAIEWAGIPEPEHLAVTSEQPEQPDQAIVTEAAETPTNRNRLLAWAGAIAAAGAITIGSIDWRPAPAPAPVVSMIEGTSTSSSTSNPFPWPTQTSTSRYDR